MKIRKLHSWNLNIEQAKRLQEKLQEKIILEAPFSSPKQIKTVAGTDLHFSPDERFARAAIVIVSFPEMKIIERITIKKRTTNLFPYIPGLLAFREIPFLLDAFRKLKTEPGVILCDGQGIAHPRKMGLATHLGIILDQPTIGCAKSLLYPAPACRGGVYGKYQKMPDRFKGNFSYLRDGEERIIGAVLRTKDNVRPVFVSPGYKMNLKLAIEIVLRCCAKYRLPEPLRYAHQETRIAVDKQTRR